MSDDQKDTQMGSRFRDPGGALHETVIESALALLQQHFKTKDVAVVVHTEDQDDGAPGRLYFVCANGDLRTSGLMLLSSYNSLFRHVFPTTTDAEVQAAALQGLQFLHASANVQSNETVAQQVVDRFLGNMMKKEGNND